MRDFNKEFFGHPSDWDEDDDNGFYTEVREGEDLMRIGQMDGYNKGLDDGYNKGLDDGFDSGYEAGYREGNKKATEKFKAVTKETNILGIIAIVCFTVSGFFLGRAFEERKKRK